ncbi:hypothetical protein [Moheibacter lacus]|uniref:Uncharacterized protein n=1 Tax=Moheibacter lacus TaxID=2745851 RepID=A0A838ZR36_9FLAO|nr:hypothetical protein [Moheibacter lacus]MBA5628523.1 hypothetical protein [Moheibacter lacus]
MENPFKNIIENQQVPEIIRDHVMKDIRMIKLALDMTDLVSVKYPASIINLLSTTEKKNKKKD